MNMRTPSTFLALTLLACGGDRSGTPLASASALVLPRVEPAAPAEPMRSLPAQPPTDLTNAWVDFLGNGHLAVVTDSTLHLFDGKRWTERTWPDETGLSVERAYGSSQASLVVGDHSGWSARYASIQLISPVDIACKSMLANPTVAPDGSTVLVTCGADAIVLDGRSLAEKRRIKSVIPGCDNGMDLSGRLVNASTLVLEGCGGVARLNLGTGRYVCGDNAGVMGGPYAPMDERKFTAPKAPACTAADDTAHQRIGSHGTYTYLLDDKIVRGPGGANVQLEADASMPVLSPNEERMAYLTGDAIMLRELPSGAALDVRGK